MTALKPREDALSDRIARLYAALDTLSLGFLLYDPDHRLVVNVSAALFTSLALIGTVQAALAESGFCARRPELEITESVLLVNGSATVAILHGLRDLGARAGSPSTISAPAIPA
ncbi:hypothetical protein Y590_03745 [Methylobacterium sp. AMS5]|nr:hypothetical protein Y590_03745 [Methylobacterium sp. AMS5]